MFDQQLTFDGRAEDIPPSTRQDRLFTAPKTMRGQMPLTDGSCLVCDKRGHTRDHRGYRTDGWGQYVSCVHRAYTAPIGPDVAH